MKKLALAAILAAAACQKPGVASAPDAPPKSAAVSGTVVYAGAARGDAVILAFDAADPPPPEGFGRPVNFTVVPAARLFGDGLAPGQQGPFTAPYALSLLPAGRYTVRAFLDRCRVVAPGCHGDFAPFWSVTDEPNQGDVGGGHAHLEGGKPVYDVVELAAGQVAGEVGVALSDGATLDRRPAFRIAAAVAPGPNRPGRLTLEAVSASAGGVSEDDSGFYVQLADLDGDGVPDDRDADGLPDVYPRVFLRKVSEHARDPQYGLFDENDRDGDGKVDAAAEPGATYPWLHGAATRPNAAVLPAAIDPTKVLPLLTTGGKLDLTKRVRLTSLDVIVTPAALDASDPAHPRPLDRVPGGRYAVTVMEASGQTWRVPNELQPGAIARLGTSDAGLADQGETVAVPGFAPQAAGAIGGTARYAAAKAASLWAFGWAPGHLPPPLGADAPDAVSVTLPWEQSCSATGCDAPFELAGLADGAWTVELLADLDGNFYPSLYVTAGATAGDLAGTTSATVSGGLATPPDVAFQPVPLERPRFTVKGVAQAADGSLTAPLGFTLPSFAPAVFELDAGPTGFAPFDGDPAKTLFTAAALGPQVELGRDGLAQIAPRLYLRKIDDQGADDLAQPVVLAVSADPMPFLPALPGPAIPAASVRAVAAPAAFDVSDPQNPKHLPAPPPGRYAIVAVNATGQTWRIPNALAPLATGSGAFATQGQGAYFEVKAPAAPPPAGEIDGGLLLPPSVQCGAPGGCGNVYVFAYPAANPPPPDGFGTPASAAVILGDELFAAQAAGQTPAYALPALPDGAYVVRALYDASRDFNAAIAALAGPSLGDLPGLALAGAAPRVVSVAGAPVGGVDVTLLAPVDHERPAFAFLGVPAGGDVRVDGLAGAKLMIQTAPALAEPPAIAPDPSLVKFTVKPSAGGADLDGDGFPDLGLSAALVALGADERADAAPRTVVPVQVSPLPFLPLFAGADGVVPPDAPAVDVDQLLLVAPPFAVLPDQSPLPGLLDYVPPGRYALYLFDGPLHWRVPNEAATRFLDPLAAGAVPPAAAGAFAAQGAAVVVPDPGPLPAGALSGVVSYSSPAPHTVVVAAYAALPGSLFDAPPAGIGPPAATAVATPRFQAQPGGGGTPRLAPFAFTHLAPGDYTIRAFADVDGDFSPFYRVRAGNTAGDLLGGVLGAPCGAALSFQTVATPAANLAGVICSLPTPLERPQFRADAATPPVLSLAAQGGSPYPLVLDALALKNAVVQGDQTPALFVDKWSDVNGDGQADDLDQNGVPDLYPRLVLRLLDASDPTGLTFDPRPVVILPATDPSTFEAGHPATDVTATAAVPTQRFFVPSVALDLSNPLAPQILSPAPAGRYAMTLFSLTGQTWTLPNELAPALYPAPSAAALIQQDGQVVTQGDVFTVKP